LSWLVYALVEAPDVGWDSPQTILLFAGSALLFAAFAVIESRHRAPLVPLRFLLSRTLVGANAVMLLNGALAVRLPFVLTLYAQQVLGYSAVKFALSSVMLAVAVAWPWSCSPGSAWPWRSGCRAVLGKRRRSTRSLPQRPPPGAEMAADNANR
jgi:hypothetical protein